VRGVALLIVAGCIVAACAPKFVPLYRRELMHGEERK
jgi:hypothetical protein